MPVCATCGQENPEIARFCLRCGAALEAAAPTREVRKTVTVVFADVTGSTKLGERLDPESLRRVMGRYFAEMKGALERHGHDTFPPSIHRLETAPESLLK